MTYSPSPTLVVSIINYKTGTLTLDCIRSVLDDIDGIDAQIVVVDNRSDDGSAEQIEQWILLQDPIVPIRIVRSARNSGFSGGHNQGLATTNADYYLILNSDAVLRPGFFRAMLATATNDLKAGLFAPRIEYDDGLQQVSCFRFPSPVSELIRGADSGPVTRLLAHYNVPLTMPPPSDEIGWASFACILLRGSMVAEVGPMDDGYFLYFEDAEYCYRTRKAGWRIAYVPEARVVHFRGGSGPVKALQRERKRLPEYYYASRTRFFYQVYGWTGLMAANALWMIGRLLAHSRRFVGKTVPQTNEREIRDIWINALSPLDDARAPNGK